MVPNEGTTFCISGKRTTKKYTAQMTIGMPISRVTVPYRARLFFNLASFLILLLITELWTLSSILLSLF